MRSPVSMLTLPFMSHPVAMAMSGATGLLDPSIEYATASRRPAPNRDSRNLETGREDAPLLWLWFLCRWRSMRHQNNGNQKLQFQFADAVNAK